MFALRLYCFGRFELTFQDTPLPRPATVNSQSLLAYLACNRSQPITRDKLINLFWGERPENRARRSLSTALWHIRRCLPEETFIRADNQVVQFTGDIWLDVDAFNAHVEAADLSSLEMAVSLYIGDFLDGFYNDWVINERYHLNSRYLEALRLLIEEYEKANRHQQALDTALFLLEQDPLQESVSRAAMRSYFRLGRRHSALEHYQRFREIIRQELDIEPMPETVSLAEDIGSGRFSTESIPSISVEPIQSAKIPTAHRAESLSLPFLGRSQEMERLNEFWQAGKGGLLLISGEAGIGKSRLLEEFTRLLPGKPVLYGRCYEFERLLPYQPFGEALRLLLANFKTADWQQLPTWTIGELSRLLPELVERLPEQKSAGLQPDRIRLFYAISRLLALLGEKQPLLLILEDLHWAAESTLQLLHYLVRQSVPSLFIIGTFRPEIVGPEHPLTGVRRQLGREKLASTLNLSRLSRRTVEAIVSRMGGNAVKKIPDGRLYEETEGNPFFLVEIIRSLYEVEAESFEEGHERFVPPLPTTITAAVLARVNRLPIEAQEGLRLAAVFGREFDFAPLKAILGQEDEQVLELIELWLRHFLVEEGSGANGRDYAFSHHKVQEVLYTAIPNRRKQQLHARAATVLEASYAPGNIAVELAFHFRQGSNHDSALIPKAIHYLKAAGEQAAAQYAHSEAVAYFSQALALLPEEDGGRLPLLMAREKVFDNQGNRQAQAEDLAELARLALNADRQTVAAFALRRTNFAIVTGQYGQAVEAVQAAVSAALSADLKVEALAQWALAFFHQGRYDAAVIKIQEALAASRREKLPSLEARCLTVLGLVRWQQSRFEEAETVLKTALLICRRPKINDRVGQGNALGNLGIICRYQGHYSEAHSYFQQALAIWQEMGHQRGESLYLTNLGVIAMDTADFPAARDYYQQALTIAREIGERENEQMVLNNLCGTSIYQGDFKEALELGEEALRICRDIGSRRSEGVSHMNLGDANKYLVRLDTAESHYEQALAIRREQGDRRGEGLALCGLGETAFLRGNHQQAVTLLRQSLAILQEIEDKAEECRALAGLGEALLGDEQLREAAVYLEQGLQLSRKLHHKWLECRIICGLTEVAVAKGEQKTAANLRQRAIELAQKIGAKALEAKARSIQIQ